MKKTVGFMATVSLVACPLLSSAAVVAPAQSSPKMPSPVASTKQGENPILARNTTKKTDAPAPEAPAKIQKVQNKETISRCWKRLMNMAREVRHAHHKKNKI